MLGRQPRRGGATLYIHGKVKTGRSTKALLRSVEPRQIVVIDHPDLDEMGAAGLIAAKVKAVINAAPTMTGKYPVQGPPMLFKAGIPIMQIQPEHFGMFSDGEEIAIDEQGIHTKRGRIGYTAFTEKSWRLLNEAAKNNLNGELSKFIDNTLYYAKKEKEFFIRPLPVPKLRTAIAGRHVVVVVRGSGYKEDLLTLHDYIQDYRPVLVGVDGGADALMESGYTPHAIIGDMDSVSDAALKSGAELIVHAYPDGRAPGMARIEAMGLKAKTVAAPGMSEDVAMLIAYEKNAELIVTVGTHTHLIDFLEKGRRGMASTMMVRMKIGSRLVDAKGVSRLYHRPVKLRSLWMIPAAGVFPLLMLGLIHPGLRHFAAVMWTFFKVRLL
ncbi:MAG TPA: putative cytokinetic ring protein SteA [Bacilli bacterium]